MYTYKTLICVQESLKNMFYRMLKLHTATKYALFPDILYARMISAHTLHILKDLLHFIYFVFKSILKLRI